MKKTCGIFLGFAVLLAASVRGEEPSSAYQRKGTWAETLLAHQGPVQPQDFRRDFPMQTISFHNVYGWKFKGWPTPADLAGFEAVLRRDLLMADRGRFEAELQELDARTALGADRNMIEVLALFERVLLRERERLLATLPPIAFIRRTGYGLRGTNATMFSQRTSKGSALCVFDPATQSVRTLFETAEGFIMDIKPSYDGEKLVMSYKPKHDEPFHIWEIRTDGTGLRQLTSGPYHDFNPVYYPDGRIVFSSSRVESFSLCQDYLACALYVMGPDGSDLRRVDFTTLSSVAPSVLHDGSLVCTRWEYQDKNIFSWQGLWTLHPDGRQLALYYGNTLTVPNALYGPQPIPGTDRVMITMAAHHHPPVGDIAIVDRTKGVENPAGMTQITHATTYQVAVGATWRDCNWQPGDLFFPLAYVDPCPIHADVSLVSFGDNGFNRHQLYLLASTGLVFPLYAHETQSCFSAVPLQRRPRPVALAGDAPTEPGPGTFFVQDVYQGLLQQGVPRGSVKALRVIRQTPKKWNTEGPRYHDHYPVAGYGSYYIKENLGTAPVHEDGTAFFTVPAPGELYFIALDAKGKEIQRMGTVTQIMPGEQVACIGCHEDRMSAAPVMRRAAPRLGQAPDPLTPPPSGAGPFDYVNQVQPVFDTYCVSCHSGRNPKGRLDLSGDKTRFFNMSYDQLVQRGHVEYYYINQGPTGVFPAMKTGSMVSRLTQRLETQHSEVDVDDASRRRVYAWIDSNVQYYATWDMSRPHTTGGRDPWMSLTQAGNRSSLRPEPWMKDLTATYKANCLACHGALHNPPGAWADMTPKNYWINLTRPENSRLINAHLSEAAGGMGLVGEKNNQKSPRFADTNDPVYQALLKAIEQGKAALLAKPRMDMPGGRAVPQERNFQKVF